MNKAWAKEDNESDRRSVTTTTTRSCQTFLDRCNIGVIFFMCVVPNRIIIISASL
jgi:hypothetical protein